MTIDQKDTAIYVAHEDNAPCDPTVPEKNLLRAVLLSALSDLRKPGEASRRAQEYLLSKEEDYLFSFISICDYLLIDPRRILTVVGLGPKNARDDQLPVRLSGDLAKDRI